MTKHLLIKNLLSDIITIEDTTTEKLSDVACLEII